MPFNVDNVRIVKIPGSGVLSSKVIRGMVFTRTIHSYITSATDARIAVFTADLDHAYTETKVCRLQLALFTNKTMKHTHTHTHARTHARMEVHTQLPISSSTPTSSTPHLYLLSLFRLMTGHCSSQHCRRAQVVQQRGRGCS